MAMGIRGSLLSDRCLFGTPRLPRNARESLEQERLGTIEPTLTVRLSLNMKTQNAYHGALVADAATMGLHWLYDQDQIALIETTGSLLFRHPDSAHYADKRGAFVHEARRAGQLSHYGESARIAGALALEGQYTVAAHRQVFMDTFGPCGSFHGYADRPTKHLIARMLLDGDELNDPSGMDDNQMPGVCPVPGLFAADVGLSQTLDAVRVITVNTDVLHSAEAVYSVLSQLAQGIELKTALVTAAEAVDGKLGELMRQALDARTYEPLGAAQQFGLACYVEHAMPVTWHLLNHATDFESTVRDNIRCGGDSCGRAMAIGSIAGLAFGTPDAMRQKVTEHRVF